MQYKFNSFILASWKWYLIRPHEFFMDLFKEVRDFFVRGWRGYSDSDCWGTDWYLARIVPEMLKQMQKDMHGYPADFVTLGESTPELDKKAFEEWRKTIQEMIDGFDAFIKQDDVFDMKEWRKLEKIRKQGFAQFGKYFGNLWD